MAASEQAAPDRERAETYLRLQAEAELRLALTMRRYRPPRERMAGRLRRRLFQFRRMRRRRAAMRRVMRLQSGGQVQSGQPVQSEGHAQAARKVQQALAVAGRWAVLPLRRWHAIPGRRPASAEDCRRRLAVLAGALAATGAISGQVEAEVLDGLRAALAARSLIDPHALLGDRPFQFRPATAAGRAPGPAAGPLRAIPVGMVVDGEIQGHPVRIYLGALVLDPSSAALTVHIRFPAELVRPDPGRMPPVRLIHSLNHMTVADDRGGTYRAHFGGGGIPGRWDGRFTLMPAPPAHARWLDVTLPGATPVRVRLDAAPPDLHVGSVQLAAGEAADRYLDVQTAGWLQAVGGAQQLGENEDGEEPALFRVAAGLLAAGVLTASSPSVRRLAAVAARYGRCLPRPLTGVKPGSLPADWLSLLARSACADGPAGVIAVAAALPEVDGVSCVLTELVSEPESVTLQAHARGWPEPRHRGMRSSPISWTARDDLGGWYAGGEAGWSYSDGEADLDLRLHPPVNPHARSLQIILTGKTREVSVTVPLDWQEGL